MSFEEEFPSLIKEMDKKNIAFSEGLRPLISEILLDKQRVRDIVVNIMKESDWDEYKMKKKLEEIGLEDEE